MVLGRASFGFLPYLPDHLWIVLGVVGVVFFVVLVTVMSRAAGRVHVGRVEDNRVEALIFVRQAAAIDPPTAALWQTMFLEVTGTEVVFGERGILLTPVAPTCSMSGYGRLSEKSGGIRVSFP